MSALGQKRSFRLTLLAGPIFCRRCPEPVPPPMLVARQGETHMAMHIIGAGLGRTGTYSLKLALNRLGLGPCHHMEAVIQNMPTQVPLWSAALSGEADWSAIFDGFSSTV